MVRRGPDDAGRLGDDDEAGVHLSFRRLAIIDLSEHGHQPMVSKDAGSVLVFNGELYGHAELRRELSARGVTFRGTSDTEVVLAVLEQWGEAALDRFDGMFGARGGTARPVAWCWPGTTPASSRCSTGPVRPVGESASPPSTTWWPTARGESHRSTRNCSRSDPELHHVPAPFGLLAWTGQLLSRASSSWSTTAGCGPVDGGGGCRRRHRPTP